MVEKIEKNPFSEHLFEYRNVEKKKLSLSLLITTIVMFVEIIGFFTTNSIALLSDAGHIARIIGERSVLTEVTAFQDLAILINSGVSLSPRSIVITTYALTGFAHVASIAIFVGGISAIVPERMKDLTKLGFKALIGATLANLLTASVAGIFYSNSSILIN